MIRLHRWQSGPYFAAFSLPIPDMRVEIVKICPRSATVSLSNTEVRQAPRARLDPFRSSLDLSSLTHFFPEPILNLNRRPCGSDASQQRCVNPQSG